VDTPNTGDDTESTRPDSGLEMRTFDGLTYRVSSFATTSAYDMYFTDIYNADGFSGDKLDNAAHDRALYVMDTYDVKFDTSTIAATYDDHAKFISDLVKTNDDLYELIWGHVVETCRNAILGHYLDWYTVPYVNPSAEWWPQQTVEQMTVYGKMFTTSTAITRDSLALSTVLYVNKDLLDNYNKELPYDWVKKGTWTLDKLISETKDVWTDSDGDGEASIGDTFGFGVAPAEPSMLASFDAPIFVRTEDGGYTFGILSEKMISLVEKLSAFYYETPGVRLTSLFPCDIFGPTFFSNQHAIYVNMHLFRYYEFQDNEDLTYGIVPTPKYDELQENYITFTEPNLLSIPITCQNTEFAGYIFELMTYLGYYDFYPVYLNSTLKGGQADSPEDAEMLQIIQDTLTTQFSYCYDGWVGYGFFLNRMGWNYERGSTNVAFYERTLRSAATSHLEDVLKAFRGEVEVER